MTKTTHRLHNIKKEFPKILKESMGLITKACEKAGIERRTYYNWRNSDSEFAIECDGVHDHVGDFVESKLYKLVNDENPSAIIFFCKTKLKNRGYVERVEQTGPDGGPIEIKKIKTTDTDKAVLKSYEEEVIERAKNTITKGQTSE